MIHRSSPTWSNAGESRSITPPFTGILESNTALAFWFL